MPALYLQVMEVTYSRESLPLPSELIQRMAETPQNPRYHAEGSVLEHTWYVLDRYRQLANRFDLNPADQEVLYWAAVLHDIGKVRTTRWENEKWRSPGHERAGVPLAWDVLLGQSAVSAEQRQRVLQIVRWHGFPLQFARQQSGIDKLKLLGTATDLKLLAAFNLFDMRGRDCEDREWVDRVTEHFLDVQVPKAEYELGRFRDLQEQFRGMNLRMKNAVWTAYFRGMTHLLPKLMEAAPASDLNTFNKKVFMTVGPPLAGKSTWVSQNLPEVFRVSMEEHGLAEEMLGDRYYQDRKLVEFKHFLTVYLNRYRQVVLDGCNLDGAFRNRIVEMIRGLEVEVEFLVFETTLSEAQTRNAYRDVPYSPESLEKLFSMQDVIHPWEAHTIRYEG